MTRLVTEWVNVTGGISIIARESAQIWFHTPRSTKESVDPFATPMTGVGAAGSTVLLLDGAINLGFAAIQKRLARPDLTLAAYIVALVGADHTSVDTPRNLRALPAASRNWGGPRSRPILKSVHARKPGTTGSRSRICARWVCQARDLSLITSRRASSRFASSSMTSASQDYPIGCIGYSYCLERIAGAQAKIRRREGAGDVSGRRRCDPFPQKPQLARKRGQPRCRHDRFRRVPSCG